MALVWTFFLLLLLPDFLLGAIYEYEDYELTPQLLVFREQAQFSPKDAPSKSSPGNGDSFIDLSHLRFQRQPDNKACTFYDSSGMPYKDICYDETVTTSLQVAVFRRDRFSHLGYYSKEDDETYYCCSANDIDAGACSAPNTLIVNNQEGVRLVSVALPSKEQARVEVLEDTRVEVEETGIYVTLFASCDPASGAVAVSGFSEWMNPHGFLPADQFGALRFFQVLSLLYLALGLVWAVLCARHRDDLLAIQGWISLVLLLGMVETSLAFSDLNAWNQDGMRNYSTLGARVFFGASKRALSRVLVLMVALGYGMLKPSLGPLLYQVLLLGSLYFLVSLASDLLTQIPPDEQEVNSEGYVDTVSILLTASAVLDMVFYFWILQALTTTLNVLKGRNQTMKLQLYTRFRNVLVFSLFLSVLWALYTAYLTTSTRLEHEWRQAWTIDAVWEIFYLLVLAALAVLLAPSDNSRRYAHAIELSSMDGGDSQGGTGLFDDEDSEEEDAEYGGRLHDPTNLDTVVAHNEWDKTD